MKYRCFNASLNEKLVSIVLFTYYYFSALVIIIAGQGLIAIHTAGQVN